MNDDTSGPENSVAQNTDTFPTAEVIPAGGNIALALAGGIVAAFVGAAVWAGITVASGYKIGLVAVAIGFIVGIAVRKLGNGSTPVYGVIGAVLAFAGCALGNFFSLVGFYSVDEGVGFFSVLGAIDYSVVPSLLVEGGTPMDLLFYGIAIYEGYKFSVRQ